MTWPTLLLSLGMAAAAGLIGSFAVMRRMSLAADALSHVALPGIGIALALHLHPLLGGVAALATGTALVWVLEHRARVATETVIGVVFSLALAVGTMLASGDELIDALLGSPGALGPIEIAVGLAGAAAVVAFVLTQRHRLVIAQVSADLARTSGIPGPRLELAYLLAFALTIALGLRYLGVLLMGSLIIIPAATAKVVARRLDTMLWVAVGAAMLSTLAGEALAARLGKPTGPVIVCIAAVLFLFGLGYRRVR